MSHKIAVVCFLWGSRFGTDHVHVLFAMLRRHCRVPFAAYCVTDAPFRNAADIRMMPLWSEFAEYGRCYRRLYMFRKDIGALFPHERIVMLDLDTVIVGDMTPLLRRSAPLTIWRAHSIGPRGYCLNPSYINMVPGAASYIYDMFARNPWAEMTLARERGWSGSDQSVISHRLRGPFDVVTQADGVYSYRDDRVVPLPADARMIGFYGAGSPEANHLQNTAPWIREHWRA